MGVIEDKYAELRAAGLDLGEPVGGTVNLADGGQFQEYSTGAYIYFHDRIGRAHEVHGRIAVLWNELGRHESELGYPVSDEQDTETAHPGHVSRVSEFEHGNIYWDPHRDAYEVYPPPPPVLGARETHGRWHVANYNSGVVGVHAALLKNAKILFFTYRDPERDLPGGDHHSEPALFGEWSVLDGASGDVFRSEDRSMNLFCAGQAFLADGRLLVGGGERQTGRNVFGLNAFNPDTGNWSNLGELARGRWYPTCATLPDGRVIIMAGLAWSSTYKFPNDSFEIYDSIRGLQPEQPAPFVPSEEPGIGGYDTYPFVFVVPGNKVLVHLGLRTHVLNLTNMQFEGRQFEAVDRPDRNGRTYGNEGTACLLPLDPSSDPPYRPRIMVIGGSGQPPARVRTPATRSCEILDFGEAAPTWRLAAPMHYPRVMPDCVILPDGNILVMNGSSSGYADNGANPVYGVELYNSESESWTEMASMSVPRLYHATALLLPDGRVMTAGTDSLWNPDPFHRSELRVEIFSPPYLFRGDRPVIREAPAELNYGRTLDIVTQSMDIASVVLVRCGSSTHSFNSDQRLIRMSISRRHTVTRIGIRWLRILSFRGFSILGITWPSLSIWFPLPSLLPHAKLRLTAPPAGDVAPPGYYMLFILDRDSVPSESRIVRLTGDRFFLIDLINSLAQRLTGTFRGHRP